MVGFNAPQAGFCQGGERLEVSGLWGIEAYHPKHSPEDTQKCLELARRFQLAVTGGSDFHGRYGEGERLGEQGASSFPLF